jgi:hypothetical protein
MFTKISTVLLLLIFLVGCTSIIINTKDADIEEVSTIEE